MSAASWGLVIAGNWNATGRSLWGGYNSVEAEAQRGGIACQRHCDGLLRQRFSLALEQGLGCHRGRVPHSSRLAGRDCRTRLPEIGPPVSALNFSDDIVLLCCRLLT